MRAIVTGSVTTCAACYRCTTETLALPGWAPKALSY